MAEIKILDLDEGVIQLERVKCCNSHFFKGESPECGQILLFADLSDDSVVEIKCPRCKKLNYISKKTRFCYN